MRYDLEGYYRNKSISNEINSDMYKSPILSYNRYKYEDARGHDILSNEKKNNRNLDDVRIKHKHNNWEKLANNVQGNFYFFI